MDFQTLTRKELQALCKLNKIPANITNIAMVEALKSLETVEGTEVLLNTSRSESAGLSIESTERIEVTSPRKKAKKMEVNEVLKTPLISSTRKKDLETLKKETSTVTVQTAYSTRRSTRLTTKISQEKHVDVVVLDESESESDENSKTEKVDCCGDVDSLKVKLVKIFGEFEDVDLDEREKGGEKFEEKSDQVDVLIPDSEGICNPSGPLNLDNHNVDEVMNLEGIEENISGNTIDFVHSKKQNVSKDFEGRAGEPQESLIEVEGIEELLNHKRPETGGLLIESVTSPRKKAKKMEVNEVLKTPLVSCTKKKAFTPSLWPIQLVECETMNINLNLDKPIQEKHDDVIVLDENLMIEKVDVLSVETSEQIDDVELEFGMNEVNNVKPDSDRFVNSGNTSDPSVLIPCGVVSREKNHCNGDLICNNIESPSEVSKLHHPDNANNDVINHPTTPIRKLLTHVSDIDQTKLEVVATEINNEKGAVLQNDKADTSLRQLKKQLKALINSPTPIKIKTEASDSLVVVEENEEKNNGKEDVGDDNKAKSLNDTTSLRQLKKQVKALSGKHNKGTS